MSVTFWVVGIALVVAALLFVLLPLLRYRKEAAVSATLVALLLGLPLSVALIYVTISNYDWDAPPQEARQDIPPVEDMVAALEARLAENPEDMEGWLLLGRSMLSMQRFRDSANAFKKAYELSGNTNPEAAMGYVEATAFVDPEQLSGYAGTLAEQVLEQFPESPRALWYAGIAALARGDSNTAESRWLKLLEQDIPENLRQVVQQQLAAMPGREATQQAAPAPVKEDEAGIDIQVSLADEIRRQAPPNAIIFIIARVAEGGPPLAVTRLLVSQLPASVRLTDKNVMLPGATLADKTSAKITARVSLSSNPIAQAGDLFGTSEWTKDSESPVELVIDQVVR